MRFRIAADRSELMISDLDPSFLDFIGRNSVLFKQPNANTDNYVVLGLASGTIAMFGSNSSFTPLAPVALSGHSFATADWVVLSDSKKINFHIINIRTGTQETYAEPNFSDAVRAYPNNLILWDFSVAETTFYRLFG